MPQKVVMQSVTLVRDGKRVRPAPGETVELSEEEIQQIESASPEALRDPKDESLPAPLARAGFSHPTIGSFNDAEGAAEAAKVGGAPPLEIDGPTKPGTRSGGPGPVGKGAEPVESSGKAKGDKAGAPLPGSDKTGGL